MSVVGDFTVPADAFALGSTLPSAPNVSVELDRIVAHSSNWMMPFLWVSGAGFDDFDAALASDPTVDTATVTDEFDQSRLYEITWADEVVETVNAILDHQGTLLAATGQDDEWNLRVRFASRDHLTTFQDYLDGHGQFALQQLSTPTKPHSDEYGLTEKQRDALLTAYEAGYFQRPRSVTASELADEFDLSQQAFSDRIRRGVATLVENTLVTGDQPRDPS